jgi:hypothetical protein
MFADYLICIDRLTITHIFGSALDKRIDKAELLSSSPI